MVSRYVNNKTQKDNVYYIGSALTSAGTGITVTGITCLGVGYARMHKAANLYNIDKAQRPDLRFVFGVNNEGDLSVAMQF